MSKRIKIAELLQSSKTGTTVNVKGWIRTFRNNQFIALNDGSTNTNIQVVVDFENTDPAELKRYTTGAAIGVEGELVSSQGKGQTVEIIARRIEVYGDCDAEVYPLQPKKHSLEFLREIAHLRFRTNTFAAVFRVRHALAFAIHKFFNDKGFVYIHTPIITASDAEGAGEMFRVTTLDAVKPPMNEAGEVDFSKDFFGRAANLTVSGQLEAELGALALSEVYTFGPTFRAENSNTTRHLAEFWMIEPEVAFADLQDNMDLAEDMLKYVIRYAMDNCREDLEFLSNRQAEEEKSMPQNERSEMSLTQKLEFCLANDFERITYTEAIDILRNSNPNKRKQFKYLIDGWGADLQSEHERFLVEKHFKKPVILTNYPAEIKAFYMRQDDPKEGVPGPTVAAMDILFPGIGEIVGGSQREERLDRLTAKMREMHIPEEEMYWYLDTRRFGTCPHAGYGLGFERLVLFVTGMTNIRDVIAFPRTPGNAEF
ncbi:MAG TPA: asparagine--tRNA ligase [Saprospiraceae bacterium]|nr:asparagine--tRNA ligase [Saprospiraceae bacterium]MCC6687673.1 asparagine--tRNA ligase [Saprospiraceae bacterium]HMV23412.1 asparagine--tRNA ligase [Saprospiraceae bacterium]HMX83298.1 asparagine--tRNA ligase [Saprospiraceae bacterium]HMX85750.1 asparagine--tRNA ligase [Saprospiraceae bacterium]